VKNILMFLYKKKNAIIA